MLLLIDNYDSFVFNLARYFERLGQPTRVVRNDATTVAEIERMKPCAIVIPPGPCTPNEAGCTLAVVRELHATIPMLGVCLGHQAIGAALGGNVVRANEPMHGRSSQVYHDGAGLFAELPNPFAACRYHSLVVDRATLPAELLPTAWTEDGTLMGVRHRDYPVFGVQFHPESILTDVGYPLLANFLNLSKLATPAETPSFSSERRDSPPATHPVWGEPLSPVIY